jgi:hypothetical protein
MDRLMGDLSEEEAEQLSFLLDKLRGSRKDAPVQVKWYLIPLRIITCNVKAANDN